MLYMPITYFYSPKICYVKVCCPGILNMYPCNSNNPIDFKTHFVTPQIFSCGQCEAAWNTRGCTLKCCTFQDLCALCTQICCFSGYLCSLHPRMLHFPGDLPHLHPKLQYFPGLLCSRHPKVCPELLPPVRLPGEHDTQQRQTSTRG